MKIFDNIGCEFAYDANNNALTLLGPLPGYAALSVKDAGFAVPYLVRNINGINIDYELGVGYLDQIGSKLAIKDREVSVSSNNNNPIDLTKTGNKQFYIFVHNVNFDNAFNNIYIKNSDFCIESKKAVYIVDVSTGYIIGSLPNPKDAKAVEIEVKTIGDNGSLKLNCDNFNLVLDNNAYTKLVSTGLEWVELKDSKSISALSMSDASFGILSDPSGEDRSLQFKNNESFDGSSLYQGNNSKLLFGSSSEQIAKHVIPSTGNYAIVLNQTKNGSDFIVHGTGNAPGYPTKNLYFSYDGKLGINMPSGVGSESIIRPATILHVFNTLCREGIRLENRANCYPADITLYDNPFTYPRPNGSGIARIVFAGKDANANKVNFATIETKIQSVSNRAGQLDINVSDNNLSKTTISTNPNRTKISGTSATLDVDGATVSVSGSSVSITGTNSVTLTANGVNINPTTALNINGLAIINNLNLPNINPKNMLLTTNSDGDVVAATGFKIPSLSANEESLLTAKQDGTVSASIPKNSLWPYEIGEKIGGKDLIWSRYPHRVAQICLGKATRELQIEPSPVEEFAIGDQIAILNKVDNSIIYRLIDNMVISNNIITGIGVDQDILINIAANLRVYSISKGGVLTNTIYTSGVVSSATDVVLSSRPGTNTVFNSRRKNIDFTVYGTENTPTLNVLANAAFGTSVTAKYFRYATQLQDGDGTDIPPSPSIINSVGAGSANSSKNNTANFFNAADPIWSGQVTVVGKNGRPSYYGTYDQNGNVYEWIEDDNKYGAFSTNQYICGGSWRTTDNDALRGYIPSPTYSGFDDVGFRVASKAGYSNNIETTLAINFVRVDNTDNPPDSTPLFTESWNNRFEDTNDQPSPVIKQNLGSVGYPFRISAYEVTNKQYSIFLNSVATGFSVNNLYRSNMSSSAAGGINRAGSGVPSAPFVYAVKNNMDDMPVVFVDYISAIRYINWLSNGAPTGSNVPSEVSSITEIGAYTIEAGPGNTDRVTKNRDQNYWLPNLNEWHKSAYYSAKTREIESPYSAVTIRRDSSFEYAGSKPYASGTGLLASISVKDLTYTDYLKVNDLILTDSNNTSYSTIFDPIQTIIAVSGNTHLVNQGIRNQEIITNKVSFTPFQTTFSQPILITTGTSSSDSGGIIVGATGISFVDTNGNTIPGGLFPGPDAGYLFKDPEGSTIISSSGNLIAVKVNSEFFPALKHTTPYSVIYNDPNGLLSSNPWFTVGKSFDGIEAETTRVVAIQSGIPGSTSGEKKPLLYTDRILVGPPLESYEGSLLTHGGKLASYWQPNEFLKAPGAVWNRYSKRAIEFILDERGDSDINIIKFISLDAADGGTGDIDKDTILKEFAINETVAIYNQNREVFYVKIANKSLVDSRLDLNPEDDFFLDERSLQVIVCPTIPRSFAENSQLQLGDDDPNTGRYVGYAFSVQKGAYLDMTIEPEATEKFSCSTDDADDSEVSFKPSTVNTLSIRPGIYTTFNKMAEDIDFIVYGHRPTLFSRYEPDWFNADEHGVPSGLAPALRVHSKIDNSVLGTISSGIRIVTVGETNATATGIHPDLNSKLTINTNNPYVISSLVNIKQGVLLPDSDATGNLLLEKYYGRVIPVTGILLSGTKDISNYADLTISGVTYTDALITKDVVLEPLWTGEVPVPYEIASTQKLYIPNYPLTINRRGQIVSLIPPPAPAEPSSPLNLVAEAKNNGVVLTWDVPENDGGEDIIGYIVETSLNDADTWTDAIVQSIDSVAGLPVVADKSTMRIINNPSVANEQSYLFRVRAYNSIGLGAYSNQSASVRPLPSLGPSVPRNLTISLGENSSNTRISPNITLTWTAPESGDIQQYIVEYWIYNTLNNTDIKLATWTVANNSPVASLGPVSQIQISGLDTRPLYYFSVKAQDSTGQQSNRAIYASLGSDVDPRPVGSRPRIVDENQYNFGSIVFLGGCS